MKVSATEYQLRQQVPVAEQHRRQDRQVDSRSGHDEGLGARRQVELGGREHDVGTVGGPQRQRGDQRLGEVAGAMRGTAGRRPVIRGGGHSVSRRPEQYGQMHECQLPVRGHFHRRKLLFTVGMTFHARVSINSVLYSDRLHSNEPL